MAAGRIRRVTRDPRRAGRSRSRRVGEHVGAGVHHDLVHLRVIGAGHLPGQERLGHRDQPIGQVRGRPDHWRPRGRRVRGGRRLRGRRVRGRRLRGNVSARIREASEVGAGGAQRLEQHRALQRRQPERAGQRPVFLEPPRQPATHPRRRVIGRGDLAVRPGEPLQLVPGHRPGQLGQARLGGRGGDPGQRPDLGVGQRGRGELSADDGQVPQGAGDPDVLAGGAGGHLALPRQPLRAGVHLPAGPAAAGVEVGEQDQEPAGRRGQVPGQLADLRLQPLQRHRRRPGRRRGHVSRRGDSSEDRAWTI